MQLINLHLGGRGIYKMFEGDAAHGMHNNVVFHPIELNKDSILGMLLPSGVVSSSLVQGTELVASGLTEVAKGPGGLVEAFEAERVIGVQWHPELDRTREAVYGHFVKMCERR
jgi:gamma-glutamyl-gamma-aminobutyrate hydrolase PuuD